MQIHGRPSLLLSKKSMEICFCPGRCCLQVEVSKPIERRDTPMIKKDELLGVLDLVLPAVAHREIFEYATKLCFRAKTVTAFNDDVAISVKLDTDFEGLLPAEEFAKILRSLEKDRIKFAYEGGDLVVNANKGRSISHGTLVYRGVGDDPSIRVGRKRVKVEALDKDKFPDLEMWKPGIKWEDCPGDIIEGIAYMVSENIDFGVKLCLSGDYVLVIDQLDNEQIARVSRYRLSASLPFYMAFGLRAARNVSQFKDFKVLRVAKHTIHGDGALLDLGYARIFLRLSNENKELTKRAMKLFDRYYSNQIILPSEFRETINRIMVVGKKEWNSGMEISIGKGRIKFKIDKKTTGIKESPLAEIEEEYNLEMSRLLPPIKFMVHLIDSARVLRRAILLGYKTVKDGLYIKDRYCDHIIGIGEIEAKQGGSK
jgi:hypothetical protein